MRCSRQLYQNLLLHLELVMASVCKICAGPIEPLDQHLHCVACLGLAHAEAALDESDCGLCADLPVRVLRARRDVVRGLFGVGLTAQSARVHSNTQAMFSHVDGAEAHGYVRSPPVEETVAAHLCPAAAKSLGPDISLPSKPCRTTAHLANKAYASDGEAASALHAMAVLQVFQAKLLQTAEGGVLTPEATKDLRAATDFALMATKRAAQSVGKAMGFMVVLQRHLWLNLADLKDADRKVLLNAPISPSGLFGDAVETITERFAETQKRAKAMSHVMPRRAPQQQTARSRSSSAHGSAQRRDFPRPAQAGATATAPRQEPDVRRKVWGSGRKRQGQRRSPRRDSRPPPAAKPSS